MRLVLSTLTNVSPYLVSIHSSHGHEVDQCITFPSVKAKKKWGSSCEEDAMSSTDRWIDCRVWDVTSETQPARSCQAEQLACPVPVNYSQWFYDYFGLFGHKGDGLTEVKTEGATLLLLCEGAESLLNCQFCWRQTAVCLRACVYVKETFFFSLAKLPVVCIPHGWGAPTPTNN